MSKIVYKKGNLLEAPEAIIAHGCNAQGVMGSGVAKAIKAKWPEAYRAYRHHYESRNGLFPGEVIWATVQDNKLIANCITQCEFGRDGKRYTEYDAIRECMHTINKFEQPEMGLALPLIGAGLGGGDWDIISQIIEEEVTSVDPVVYILPDQWEKFIKR